MARFPATFLIALTAAALAAVPAFRAPADSPFTREMNIDRSGNDLRVIPLPLGSEPDACEAMCAAAKGCVAYTFVKQSTTVPQPLCRLKDAAPYGHESTCCVSGALAK